MEMIECMECKIDLKYNELIDGNYCPRCRSGWNLIGYLGEEFSDDR